MLSSCVQPLFSQDHVLEDAERVEKAYLDALTGGQPRESEQLCAEFFGKLPAYIGQLDKTSLERLRRLALRIQIVSSGMAQLGEAENQVRSEVQVDARMQLSQPDSFTFAISGQDVKESDPYLPLRHWFLAHFSNPYPSIPEKEELMRQYPKHSKQQIDTWFTNIRRRSGWQELKKKYTNGTQEDFEKLIKATEREERTVMVEQCRVMIQEIKGFLRDGGRERVSDSIQEIVKKGAPATCTKRKIQARQSRGEGGGYRQTSSSSSSSQELPPLPFPFPSYPSMQMVDSPSSLYPTPLPSAPRHPSNFSSPTSSLRSVSDSSSSSFDSVLSYNSTSTTASYDTAYLPPTQTPSSPPAMSSLLSFNTPTRPLPSQESSQLLSRPLPPPVENPYFFTLNNTPLLPLLSQPEPALASSSLAGFASNGDLLV